MADTKITALTAITTVDPAVDVLPIVDVSDTTMAASGTTKKITSNQILGAGGTAMLASATITGDLTVDTSTLVVNSSQDRVAIGFSGNASSGRLQINQPLGSTIDGALRITDNATTSFVFNNVSSGVSGIWSSGAIAFGVGSGTFTEAMRLNSSGNLGLGVTPSASSACVNMEFGGYGSTLSARNTSSAAQFAISSNAVGNWYAPTYKINGYATQYAQQGFNGTHAWYTAPSGTAGNAITFTQAMTLDASGNLLVGTTSASNQERLNVSSAVSLYVARVFNTASSGGNYGIAIRYSNAAPNNGSNEFLACSDSAASRAFIYSNGGIANYQANDSNLSDARTKTDIKPLASYWNKIKALEVVTFKYNDQTHSDDNIGLIAQQVESVAPEFVSNEGFGEIPADGVPLKTIYTTDLYHAAIKALQEAMSRIEALEAKLA